MCNLSLISSYSIEIAELIAETPDDNLELLLVKSPFLLDKN